MRLNRYLNAAQWSRYVPSPVPTQFLCEPGRQSVTSARTSLGYLTGTPLKPLNRSLHISLAKLADVNMTHTSKLAVEPVI